MEKKQIEFKRQEIKVIIDSADTIEKACNDIALTPGLKHVELTYNEQVGKWMYKATCDVD